jgi:hypothetical protein
MMLTLAWKEVREHQAVWLTMVVMTIALGSGLVRLVSPGNTEIAVASAALTILGMAAAYGAVCGSMMFAGEHENGTLVFLDVFWGKRGSLWFGKLAIGAALVLAQAAAVGLILQLLGQEPPNWTLALVGQTSGVRELPGGRFVDAAAWYLVLPVVSIEAYAWGLLGSSLTRRVLASAAVAAFGVTPVWLLAILAPPQVFFPLRLVGIAILLCCSYYNFLNQSREEGTRPSAPETPDAPKPVLDRREQFIELWEAFERDAEYGRRKPRRRSRHEEYDDEPVGAPTPAALAAPAAEKKSLYELDTASISFGEVAESRKEPDEAKSPNEVLRWLTIEQARPLLKVMAGVIGIGLMISFLAPVSYHGLWPFAGLFLGVICGVAAFAPEQRDLSCQFLSAQHFPLHTVWRFKLLYWFAVAAVATAVIVIGHSLNFSLRRVHHLHVLFTAGFEGALRDVMGSLLYFTAWPIYGFCAGQIVVWYCRKNILAVIAALLVAAAAVSFWLPALLCGGTSGWLLFVPPFVMLLTSWSLVRAWASGRIKERKPVAAAIGFGAAIVVVALLHFGYRATEIPDVGEPLDVAAYRATLPQGANVAGKLINDAIMEFAEPDNAWRAGLVLAAKLPPGVLEIPRGDEHPFLLKHIATCQKMAQKLLRDANWGNPERALENMSLILALSRNLRNKVSVESYRAGVDLEEHAWEGFDAWLGRGQPDPKLLRRAFDELTRHAAETPPPLDCLKTECFHSAGVLSNPYVWSFDIASNGVGISERWVTNGITLSLEAPWEAERKTRLWRLAWAGLFRSIETPYWELPAAAPLDVSKDATRTILNDWMPAADGTGASRERVARWFDSSWLADERIFCSLAPLRAAAMRSQWRVDSFRLVMALGHHRIETGNQARELQDLVPKYFPDGLPTDPYSGQPYRFRVAAANDAGLIPLDIEPGNAVLWSTGPDKIDHGGLKDANRVPDTDARWRTGELDLIKPAPRWLK